MEIEHGVKESEHRRSASKIDLERPRTDLTPPASTAQGVPQEVPLIAPSTDGRALTPALTHTTYTPSLVPRPANSRRQQLQGGRKV